MTDCRAKLIFGCGYLGLRVARRWLARGHSVYALTRSPAHAADLRQTGVIPLIGDITRPDTLPSFPSVDTVLWAVGYDSTSGRSRKVVYVDGLANVLCRLPQGVRRFIYISSTSVYGQNRGEWVDEQSECCPRTERGRICLQAEQFLGRFFSTGHRAGTSVTILRCSGIYGPGRLQRRVAQLRAVAEATERAKPTSLASHSPSDPKATTDLACGHAEPRLGRTEQVSRDSRRPTYRSPQAWLNLIHVDDVARVVLAVEELADHGDLFIASDNRPLTYAEYQQALASQLGLGRVWPRWMETEPADIAEHLNKRCLNKKLREKLRFRFLYPDFFAGLPNALQQEE